MGEVCSAEWLHWPAKPNWSSRLVSPPAKLEYMRNYDSLLLRPLVPPLCYTGSLPPYAPCQFATETTRDLTLQPRELKANPDVSFTHLLQGWVEAKNLDGRH
ncbi:unnamed protein product [Schistocephalus solidus]|uniref:Uncharacterized protein n=1 Tax=Schistocephalus solidus TaxID=70667 RepID=A0A183SW28_SCHSO|nr:unnamed protein product [Schistocephalus solidus]